MTCNPTPFLISFIFMPWFLSGCVSVNLSSNSEKKAQGVLVTEPSPPYVPLDKGQADRAWQNPNDGATIAYKSECFSPVETSLENIRQDISNSLLSSEVKSESELFFNGRRALRSTIRGQLDGILTNIELLVFKKNHCTYIITMIAVEDVFKKKVSDFDQFLKGFRAP